MRKLVRLAAAAGAVALVGGAGFAATTSVASAQDVRVRVGTGDSTYKFRTTTRYHSPGYSYKYRTTTRYHAPGYNYKYRTTARYYYNRPAARYYYAPPRRYYGPPKRDFIRCRWVPHQGRVCW